MRRRVNLEKKIAKMKLPYVTEKQSFFGSENIYVVLQCPQIRPLPYVRLNAPYLSSFGINKHPNFETILRWLIGHAYSEFGSASNTKRLPVNCNAFMWVEKKI